MISSKTVEILACAFMVLNFLGYRYSYVGYFTISFTRKSRFLSLSFPSWFTMSLLPYFYIGITYFRTLNYAFLYHLIDEIKPVFSHTVDLLYYVIIPVCFTIAFSVLGALVIWPLQNPLFNKDLLEFYWTCYKFIR